MNDLAARRRFFAEEIEAICNLQTPALVDALAAVPRERFLPPGPWTILSLNDYMPGAVTTSRVTPDADPKRVYHNIGIAIDASRHLFNGHPATLAGWVDALALTPGARVLHVGCGLGYYTAVMAHCVGPAGRVVAVEVDDALAAGARTNLASLEWVDVRVGDGTSVDGGSFDAILVNAGVTHPEAAWLDALAPPDGRLILPLTCAIGAMGPIGKGFVIKLSKRVDTFDAAIVTMVAIYSAIGIRDPELNNRLGGGTGPRRRPPSEIVSDDPKCWGWFHDDAEHHVRCMYEGMYWRRNDIARERSGREQLEGEVEGVLASTAVLVHGVAEASDDVDVLEPQRAEVDRRVGDRAQQQERAQLADDLQRQVHRRR